MDVAVVIPTRTTGDPWRARALEFVAGWYSLHFPRWDLVEGTVPDGEPWSKGAAVRAAVDATSAEILILADADSFLTSPRTLLDAVDMISNGNARWVVPHGNVYRLREAETERIHADPSSAPRLGHTVRATYEGPPGGGITVVARDTFEDVGGIDDRFLGWGGEDVAFGWALETLAHPTERLGAPLVHLWHPHPAPTLRGSPESEELVARYTAARGLVRRVRAVVDRVDPITVEPLADPVRFRTRTPSRKVLRLPSGAFVRFTSGTYDTTDPDEADALRRHPALTEERNR